MLTGKCKEDFETWYKNIYCKVNNFGGFFTLIALWVFREDTLSEQFGVYQDFFNYVNKKDEIQLLGKCSMGVEKYYYEYKGTMHQFDGMNEARKKALLESNEMYNSLK